MRYAIINPDVETAAAAIKNAGASGLKKAKHTGIVFATMTDKQVAALKEAGYSVETVGKTKAAVIPPEDVTLPTPVAAVPKYTAEEMVEAIGLQHLRDATDPPLYGGGLRLAILDTGIRETHEDIAGSVIYSKNFTSDPMRDGFDHGTGIAGIALVFAPLCKLLNMKVLNNEGVGSEEDVALAVDDCLELLDTQPHVAPSVINISLGTIDEGNPNSPLRVACRAAVDAGIWVLAAAGNSGPSPGTITSPACERYVAAVGSANPDPFVISEFSSRGPTLEGLTKPDVVLFGEDIIMASSESDTATVAKSGTSFSCPFVASLALLYVEAGSRPTETTEQFIELPAAPVSAYPPKVIMDEYLPLLCAKPQGIAAPKDNNYGYGLPYGPLALRIFQAGGIGMDIGSIMGLMVAVMMIGMMTKVMKV